MSRFPLHLLLCGFIGLPALLNAQQYDITVHEGLPQGVNPTYGDALAAERLGVQRAREEREREYHEMRMQKMKSEVQGFRDLQNQKKIDEFDILYKQVGGTLHDTDIASALASVFCSNYRAIGAGYNETGLEHFASREVSELHQATKLYNFIHSVASEDDNRFKEQQDVKTEAINALKNLPSHSVETRSSSAANTSNNNEARNGDYLDRTIKTFPLLTAKDFNPTLLQEVRNRGASDDEIWKVLVERVPGYSAIRFKGFSLDELASKLPPLN